MDLKTTQKGDVTIVELEGRLDVHYSLEVEQSMNALIDSGKIKLVINLAKVEYLSSSGLRIFIAAMRKLKEKRGGLKLVRMTSAVEKIFKVVELIDLFEIYPTEDDALKTF